MSQTDFDRDEVERPEAAQGDSRRNRQFRRVKENAQATEDADGARDEEESQSFDPPHSRERPRLRRRPSFNLTMALWGLLAFLLVVLAGVGIAFFVGAFSSPARQQATAGAPSAPPQPQIEITNRQTFGDWIYLCAKPVGGAEQRCSIAQQLADSKSNTPVFLWRIIQNGKGGLVGEWQTRSGVIVSQGVTIDAGLDQPTRIPFQTCLPDGCQAVLDLTPDMVGKLAKATKATATIFPVGSSSGIQFPISVKGLSDGLAALKQ